jgi:hypothetical protein
MSYYARTLAGLLIRPGLNDEAAESVAGCTHMAHLLFMVIREHHAIEWHGAF